MPYTNFASLRRYPGGVRGFKLSLGFALLSAFASAQINVSTEGYDQLRTGANLSEAKLTTSNVNVNSFGKIWSYPVSGSVFAQPLYVMNVEIPDYGTRNVVYIVTMNDVVYAFDADSASGIPLWSHDLTTEVPGSTPVTIFEIIGNNAYSIVGNVGIESTPVIDTTTGTMFLVARTRENGKYFQKLHALSLSTGQEKLGGPTVISASVPGIGSESSGNTVSFDPLWEDQRSSLALSNGQIFIAWGAHQDDGPYHGWVMSYRETSLQQTGVFCDTPNGAQGGIWMSGRAPAVDSSGNVYYMTGNGTWDGVTEFGESFLKFSTNSMKLLDWFTPDNYQALNNADLDLGSSGPLIIAATHMIVGGGKQSLFYLLKNSSLGHESGTNGQIVQTLANNGGEIHGGPVYWSRSGGVGPWMYVWADSNDTLNAYHFNGSDFDTIPISQSTRTSPNGDSGGVLALSANGSTAGSGIIWSSMPSTADGDYGVHAGILIAFDADNLTNELWDSNQNAIRDSTGNWPKYSAPLIASGRVYLGGYPSDGAGSTAVSVFGLLNAPCAPTAITPNLAVGNAAWQQDTSSVTVASGSDVHLGPWPVAGGTWSWTGPNGFTSGNRALDNIPLRAGTNTFVATYTNVNACRSTQTFVITVN